MTEQERIDQLEAELAAERRRSARLFAWGTMANTAIREPTGANKIAAAMAYDRCFIYGDLEPRNDARDES